MEIKLDRVFVRSLALENRPDYGVASLELKLGADYLDDRDTEFVVNYDLVVPFSPGHFLLSLKYSAVFHTTEPITEEFKKSHFPRVNAAAVGYPYVRAFVSQFSVLAGFEVYTLPVRNFVRAEAKNVSAPNANVQSEQFPSVD